jgi:hypothetical protein
MNVRPSGRMVGAVIMAVMLGLLGAGCATTAQDKGSPLYQRIQSAKTRADHQGLAQYYDQEAKAAKDRAQQHRKMQDLYRPFSAFLPSGVGMVQHCANLVNQYEQAAEEYSGLARLHRQLAAQARE